MKKPPFLRKEKIERAAMNLLAGYGQKFGFVEKGPIPVEEILESHLELSLDFADLPARLGYPDVLGATWIQDRNVIIDQSLDPDEHPKKEGRYRFTIAHELGHWELHRHLFGSNPDQLSFFFAEEENPEPSIVCRTRSRKDPMEWQADAFAGYLLMPKEMVFQSWREIYGGLEPYIAVDEIAYKSSQWGLSEDITPTVDIAREMAEAFLVSGQAMQIRLVGLNLIKTEESAPALFA